MHAKPATVVVLEDEAAIGEALGHSLTREGFRVWREQDGTRGLDLVRERTPDVVLLDLMLPGMEGLEVCRQIRSDPSLRGTSVIIVTAKTEESDVVVGLGLGADDYVTKPFRTRELMARVRTVLRRSRQAGEVPGEVIRHGDLVIDLPRHEVTRAGEPVVLTATEFRLLHLLAGNPGRVFTRDQILNQVIGYNAVVIDRNIDVHVRAIRRKLGPERDRIETVRGVGYRFSTRVASGPATPAAASA